MLGDSSKLEKAIAVAATFTAEPLEETLAFWMEKLDFPMGIHFAAYNQVFQQLLDPAGLLGQNQTGVNVILLRLEDWLQSGSTVLKQGNHHGSPERLVLQLTRAVEEFVAAMRSAAGRSRAPYLVCVCPPAPTTLADSRIASELSRLEQQLLCDVAPLAGVYTLSSAELLALYPVADYYNPYGEESARIPYTPPFFAALATTIARKIQLMRSTGYKVIVLDCDQTLWRGVCGEDGAAGVDVDPPHCALQEFMLRQREAGRLLCLCSKNNQDDVLSVFEQKPQMPLRPEHFAARRLNWRPKSENIRALADELQLGLESFIFLDDSPLECAEVRNRCPEVTTIQLPENAAELPCFLEHIWAFDHLTITEVDRQRSSMYRQEADRERLREQSLTLADFLAGLALEVRISEPQSAQLDRVAQLTQRTNQFNMTTIRRSASDIADLCRSRELECLVIEVSDRFGEYGLVGVLLFQCAAEALAVETFLLSCRALGRGVEHRMLARLAQIARARGLGYVDVNFSPSGKNQPAIDFLRSVGAQFEQPRPGGSLFRFPVSVAAAISFVPAAASTASGGPTAHRENGKGRDGGLPAPSALFRQIAVELRDAEKVLQAATAWKERPSPELGGYVPPRTPLERMLAEIWSNVLRVRQIGVFDRFFELGDSLQAAQAVTRLEKLLGARVHFAVLFDRPTIAQFAKYLLDEYPAPLRALLGEEEVPLRSSTPPIRRITDADLRKFRQIVEPIRPSSPTNDAERKRNPAAVFILSAPRSGSTLLRVMLAGHPRLFAPPELELLGFPTLGQRRAALDGKHRLWLEGSIRALMEIHRCGPDEAKRIMEDFEQRNTSTQEFYRALQDRLGDRILVDKSPSYSLEAQALERAESDFEQPLYVHLLRHPCAMIRSFEKARLEQIFVRYELPFARRELAELIWTHCNENIVDFLRGIPAERQFAIRYENLVDNPQSELAKLCEFLGIEFHSGVVDPYDDVDKRMTSGLFPESRMLGDVKFLEHKKIDPAAAVRWKEEIGVESLGEATRRLALSLGYQDVSLPEHKSDLGRPLAAIAQTIAAAPRTGSLPLSFAQQRLWFINELEPGETVYNVPFAARLKGPLDTAVLVRCLNEVLRRHEVLRTTFRSDAGEPVQRIGPPEPLQFPVTDLSGLPVAKREAEVRRLLDEELRRPFDLSQDLMLRAGLLRLDEQEHVFFLTLHHIATDGWSLGVLFRELTALYAAFNSGRPSPLAELPIQYADFAAWQREWLRGEVLAEQLGYWKSQIGGAPPVLELPTDRPRPAMQTYHGARKPLELDGRLAKELLHLGRKEDATLFMVLLAAFQTLLHRYSGQEDIVVGAPIAGRNRLETENLIGFFVNTLALRTDLSGNPAFRELMRRVRRTTLDAFEYQDLPFEKLVDELNPQRNLSYPPLFQAMFVLQNAPREPFELPGIRVSSEPQERHTSKFDLTLFMTAEGEVLRAELEYNTDLFDPTTIERMLRNFRTLLEGIVADPGQPIGELPLQSPEERHQVLVEWSGTAAEYPRDSCVHDLFESQAARTPDAVALVFDDLQLTYAELNARANQWAHYLRRLGVGPDVLVGICQERSLDLIAGILGILKAGGAYVPLDPAYPKERLAFMLADGHVRHVVTHSSLCDRLTHEGLLLLCCDEVSDLVAGQCTSNLPSSSSAENLAYVIYTSGSTGEPKGVEIPHRAINRLLFGVDYARFDASLRVAQLAPVSFDASTLEIWAPLLHGGTCVLFPEGVPDFAELEKGLRRHRVQTLWLTASLFNAIVDERPQTLRGIEQLLTGGEALSPPHIRRAMTLLGSPPRLINGYGPTESTTFACCYPIPQPPLTDATSVPIGRPIANTRAYVLDARRQLSPIGVPGELYLGGDGLARGYLNRPELTAERFVANPFQPGTRLYRTGDRVRLRADGNLEFLGRLDDQVKLRGYRIELGEIETALALCPGVTQSAVALREDRGHHVGMVGDKRLVGYYVPEVGNPPSPETLDRRLREKLPEYMVPSAFVALERLPLTLNGKVDRRSLPAPSAQQHRTTGYVAPRTEVEARLAAIWAEVLELERVGIHDNFFFDLGGHSLLAARLVSRIAQETGQAAPLSLMFREPTISGQAQHFSRPPSPDIDLLEPVRSSGTRATVLWFGNGRPVASFSAFVPPEHPIYWCRPEYLDGRRLRHTTVQEIAACYCRQILQAGLRGPFVLCGYSFAGLVAYETACQLQSLGKEVALVFLLEPSPPAGAMASGSVLHETFGQRVAREVRQLRSAAGSEKLPRLYEQGKSLLSFMMRPCVIAYCEFLLGLGRPVPLPFRWTYALNNYRRAIRRYAPQPIQARLVVVHQQGFMEHRIGLWGELATGEFRRHDLPSIGHLDFLKMPYIEEWMRLFLSHIAELPEQPNALGR
jgi:amino acid adenylation domain-containing protein/FkbH-like protein